MSYCRWSDDRGQCDVYVYEGAEGYVCHVAEKRRLAPDPWSLDECMAGYLNLPEKASESKKLKAYAIFRARYDENQEARNRARVLKIDNPHAGEAYLTETAAEMAERLELLRDSGLNVPQYAIDALRDEGDED